MENAVTTHGGGVETTEAPGRAFPIAKLKDARDAYLRSSEEAGELEGKLARAESDQEQALGEVDGSEDEQFERISAARNRKDVTARKLAHRRLDLTKALGKLEEAYPPAVTELSTAISIEFSRRQEVLSERVLKALGFRSEDQVPDALFPCVMTSPHLRAVRECNPDTNVYSPLSVEKKAQALLAKFAQLETAMKERI